MDRLRDREVKPLLYFKIVKIDDNEPVLLAPIKNKERKFNKNGKKISKRRAKNKVAKKARKRNN